MTTKGVDVIVTADDQHRQQMSEWASRLRKAGLEIGNVLEFTGQITGHWPKRDTAALKNIAGVASVDISRDVTISPPEADTQ